MVFSSHLFFYYFLPAALVAYYLLPRRGRNGALALLSYAFYGWANPLFMALMLFSTVVDYACGLAIERGRRRAGLGVEGETAPVGDEATRPRPGRRWVVVSVITNLALLGFFKYFNFGAESWDAAAALLGAPSWRLETALRVTLPLGISFYTFQSMSYTLDVYRGRARALANFVDFACYVSLFPQLVAGPIIRFNEVADQLRRRLHSVERFARGAVFVCLGMAKKVLLANPCGWVADAAFDAASVRAADAWLGALAYGFQIYFDFSGYSDMAIGLGLMLGFVFPKNFDSPYKAESITDFWRRWHISLSTWLRDYLYVPLGGNRRGPRRTYANLGTVMVLGGLWHGASWNFVFWGALHGGWLALERAMGKRGPWSALPRPLRIALTFLVVTIGWVFFRAADLPAAGRYLAAMVGAADPGAAAALVPAFIYDRYHLLVLILAAGIAFAAPQTWDWSRRLSWPKGFAALGLLLLALVAMASQGYNPFIYFIF
jgi:alginate O-acetyltransferase complex protein AlgI